MTSYGQGVFDAPEARITIEIHTVNKKNLEINCHMPRELRYFETMVRALILKSITSGQIMVHIQVAFHQEALIQLSVNIPFVKQLQQAYQQIEIELGLKKKPITLEILSQYPELFIREENSSILIKIEPALREALQKALNQCLLMKKEEGLALKKDFEMRLEVLKEETILVQKISSTEPARYREKLEDLYAKLMITPFEEDRILREIALLSEKIDITEELTRLFSHYNQFSDLLESSEPVGKALDFLSQEIHREINTLSSKSHNLMIIKAVLKMKTELARIREQVLNVE